jgi:GntR family transcriptional regulator
VNELFGQRNHTPLYVEVRDTVLDRISSGAWKPGEMLPSEFAIGKELGVSQGTVRKALDDLASRNVVIRRQGKGTFVAEHTEERALFHFFNIETDENTRALPTSSRVLSCRRHKADKTDIEALHLNRDAKVVEIRRVREMAGEPAITETVIVSAALFADIDKRTLNDVPNELYQLYEQKYGITVHRAEERVRAVAASEIDAKLLGIKVGTPLLEIERVAETVDGRPVERRISRCLTEGRHYLSTIV